MSLPEVVVACAVASVVAAVARIREDVQMLEVMASGEVLVCVPVAAGESVGGLEAARVCGQVETQVCAI